MDWSCGQGKITASWLVSGLGCCFSVVLVGSSMRCLVYVKERKDLLPALLRHWFWRETWEQRRLTKSLFPPFLVLEVMNPVYSPGSSGVPYANAKGIGYPGKQVQFCFHYWTLNTWQISRLLRMPSVDKPSSKWLRQGRKCVAHGTGKSRALVASVVWD